jgi:3-oxoacyl-[acyl-carrier protein] reductase
MTYSLKDKVCVITGGNKGIGKATAKKFSESGANVVIVARDETALKETVEEIRKAGGKCMYIQTDLTDREQIKNLFNEIRKKFGRIDVLVNNAGGGTFTPSIKDTTLEEWDYILALNLTSAFLCCKEAMEIMESQEEGKIINVSSTSGTIASTPGGISYRAAKHGLMGLSKVLLKEVEKKGISVCAIVPSHIKTETYRKGFEMGTGWTKEKKEIWESAIEPEDIADAILFVATRDKKVIIPKIAIYPRADIPKYGMEV